MSGLCAPNGTDIDFASFEDGFGRGLAYTPALTYVRVDLHVYAKNVR